MKFDLAGQASLSLLVSNNTKQLQNNYNHLEVNPWLWYGVSMDCHITYFTGYAIVHVHINVKMFRKS